MKKHKEGTEDLKNSEERLKILFEFAPDAYYINDLKGNFIDGNRAAEEITGYKREELIGKNFLKLKLLHPKDIPAAVAKLAQNKLGRSTGPDEFRLIRKDGSQVTLEIRTYPIKIERKTVVLGIARDITVRKKQEEELERHRSHLEEMIQEGTAELSKANEQLKREIAQRLVIEEELRKSEEKYRLIAEGTRDLIAITTFALRPTYIYLSPSHKTVMGYDPEELMGKSGFEFIHPDDKKKLLPLLKQYLAAKGKKIITGKDMDISERIEFRARDKSGKWHELESTANKIGNHILFISRDVTERKQAEKEKRELEEKLFQSEKMEAVGRLASGVAHDLNNILGAVVGYPDLLLLGLPENSPLRNTIMSIKDSGLRAAKLVEDLLTLSRRGVRVTEVINLNDIITGYLKSPEYTKLIRAYPNIKIKTNLRKDLLNIMGSPTHLRQTIMNLVANASEAMPSGGVIKLATANRHIGKEANGSKSYLTKGDYAVLSVSDSGIGIADRDLKKIFEPFYTSKVMGQSGTGLGMAIVWWTVNDHKGYIDVESEEGKGTTVDLYFPATRSKISSKKSPWLEEIENIKGNGEKILLVDDEKLPGETASVLLSKLGYSVDTVESGEQAIEYLEKKKADLVILDMIMAAGLDGLDTYREILKRHPGTKAIIISGFSESERVREAQRLGAGEFVKKPFTLSDIGKAVKNELAG